MQKGYHWQIVIMDSLFAVVISIAALALSDIIWILIVFCILICSKKNTKYETSITFILSCILQMLIVFSTTYIFRMILFISTKSFSIHTLTTYGHLAVVATTIMEISLTVPIIYTLNKFRQKITDIKLQISNLKITKQLFWMVLGLFIALETLLIISELELVTSTIMGVLLITFSLITILIIYQIIIFIKAYSVRQEAANIRKQNSQLNNYMENIEQQYTEFKKFKHDYNNLLLSLKTLIDGNDSDQLKSYYEELKQQSIVQQTNDAQMMVATDKIDNEPVRGLLIQKFFAAQKLNIQFSIETPETAIKLTNHVVPIVRILGILLDNAIEYVHSHPQYAQAVTCAFINHEHSIELIIENPTSELIDLDQIFELGYSTKGSDHGFGLSNVSELVRQIPNLFINTELKDEKIQISLVLQKEAPFVSHLLT